MLRPNLKPNPNPNPNPTPYTLGHNMTGSSLGTLAGLGHTHSHLVSHIGGHSIPLSSLPLGSMPNLAQHLTIGGQQHHVMAGSGGQSVGAGHQMSSIPSGGSHQMSGLSQVGSIVMGHTGGHALNQMSSPGSGGHALNPHNMAQMSSPGSGGHGAHVPPVHMGAHMGHAHAPLVPQQHTLGGPHHLTQHHPTMMSNHAAGQVKGQGSGGVGVAGAAGGGGSAPHGIVSHQSMGGAGGGASAHLTTLAASGQMAGCNLPTHHDPLPSDDIRADNRGWRTVGVEVKVRERFR